MLEVNPQADTGICSECGLVPLKVKKREGKIRYACSNAERRWEKSRKSRSRDARLQYLYGITERQYDAMVQSQKGVCAICGGVSKDRRLAVDHCHTSSRVRGLLCEKCNLLLGYANDSVDTLQKAIEYLA